MKISRLLGFIALIPALVLSAARVLHYESPQRIVVLSTFLPYFLLVAYLVFAIAIFVKSKTLAVVCAVLIVCHLAWFLPELTGARSLPSDVRDAPKLRIFSHNVKFDNRSPDRLAADIFATHPDVVLLQEASNRDVDALYDAHALDAFPNRFEQLDSGPIGLAVYSKLPLHDATLLMNPGFPGIRAVLEVGGKSVVLYNVHVQSPVQGNVEFWHRDLVTLHDQLTHEAGRVIAAGDFNSTYAHRPFRALLTNGYREAHIERGRGYATTWPVDHGFDRGFIRLDHVLMSTGVWATHVGETGAGGSDHRGVVADLAID